MELKLKGYGTAEITSATLVDGGDIRIESADGFEIIKEITGYDVSSAFLVETDFKWKFAALLTTPIELSGIYDTFVASIENQDDIYILNALL